jgi:hypothetical protein
VVLNHLAAILFFGGPLFYIGLWMLLDPAPLASAVRFGVRRFRPEQTDVSSRLRTGVRWAGVLLLLCAIAV